MPKFRKKPVVIDAMQFDGTIASASAICQWANAGASEPLIDYVTQDGDDKNAHDMLVHTLEGDHTASPGDWIIRGVAGEFYPCKPEIFAATYEAADGSAALTGVQKIAAERARQVFQEGWDAEHDARHLAGTLALAGAAYVLHAGCALNPEYGDGWPDDEPPPIWPWEDHWWKPKTPLRDLVRAGALIAAEIDGLGPDDREDG